jgi:hypothetical protein
MKKLPVPQSGRKNDAVYLNTRYGQVVRQYVRPSDPRTPHQLDHRENLTTVSRRWRTLDTGQHAAWRVAAAKNWFVTDTGTRVQLNGYTFFVRINLRRADLDLPGFDLPPDEPIFNPNPVEELVITNIGGETTIKVRVPSPPAQYTLVQGPAPTRTGVRCVQHFPFLGFLPAPIDGWSYITELYEARYGVPKFGQAIWIRICQHIDGWIDVPKVLRARVPAPDA